MPGDPTQKKLPGDAIGSDHPEIDGGSATVEDIEGIKKGLCRELKTSVRAILDKHLYVKLQAQHLSSGRGTRAVLQFHLDSWATCPPGFPVVTNKLPHTMAELILVW